MPRQIRRYIDSLKQDVEFQVGKDAKDNIHMLHDSQYHDIWLHIDGEASCHVIAKIHHFIRDGITINKKQLTHIVCQGAVLCKQYSKFKSAKNVEIVYTKVFNVTPTEKVGEVVTTNTKTITI